MDLLSAEDERKLVNDSGKLLKYLADHFDHNNQQLIDDEQFCNEDIDATIHYIEKIEEKFYKKTQELKNKLEEIRRNNAQISAQNKQQFDKQLEIIEQLHSLNKNQEALNKFKTYQNNFAQRPTVIRDIPKLHMNEHDIEQYFSPNHPTEQPSMPPPPPPVTQTPAITISILDENKQDDSTTTSKQQLRRQKQIETIKMNKDNGEMESQEKEQDFDRSTFGSRSRLAANQPAIPINNTMANDVKPPTPTPAASSIRSFSTRLGPTKDSTNQSSSHRTAPAFPSTPNNHVNPRNNQEQVRSTPTPPNVVCSSPQQQTAPNQNNEIRPLALTPNYQLDPNHLLLIACNAQYIMLFKSQLNRLDRWDLGAIERRTHNVQKHDWHDGLIISMGLIDKNDIYIFTEREFFVYSIPQRRKLTSRILPRGNDDGSDIHSFSYNEFHRGLGTVYDKYMYHIYLNRSSHWTLSKTLLQQLVHMHDFDLTLLFPDVERFIHFCVNDRTINFLVQMSDSSYAVVFCSVNDCNAKEDLQPISLLRARQPLTICSTFIESTNKYMFYINDPSIDILHMISTKEYVHSYAVDAHAICYVADRRELMIVRNKSICSLNLN